MTKAKIKWCNFFGLWVLFLVALPVLAEEDTTGNYLLKKIEKADAKTKVDLYNELFLLLEFRDGVKAKKYLDKAYNLSKEENYKSGRALSLKHYGFYAEDNSNYTDALKNYFQSLKYYEEIKDKKGVATLNNNIGSVYFFRGRDSVALVYYGIAEKIHAEIKNQDGLTTVYNNMGAVYSKIGEYKKALFYTKKALRIFEKSGLVQDASFGLNNIGIIYDNLADISQDPGIKRAYLDSSLQMHLRCMDIKIRTNDDFNLGSSYGNSARVYMKLGDYPNARKNILSAIKNGEKYENINLLRNCYNTLSRLDSLEGDFKSALRNTQIYHSYLDKMLNEAQERKMVEAQMKYEYDKRDATDSIQDLKNMELQQSEIARRDAEIKAKNTMQYFLFGGLFLVLIFGILMYNRFRITRKQKDIIEVKEKETQLQKHVIEEKQKEIIDSINYARRLQHAILAPRSEIEKVFPNHFLIYRPKDIVAGDFYFFEKTTTHIFYAAADCTGHGVPGAMVSIVCSNALTRCVKEFGMTDPGKILDKTRELILETFQKSGEDVKDGMDISLLVVDHSNNSQRLLWSGANNPLWFMENGEIKEITADKQPIGKSDHAHPFTTHILPSTVSTVFLFTDGYADQFGGPKGKKFKYATLQKLLVKTNELLPREQCDQLVLEFEKWKGDLEQLDDVCIIGIRF